ncbi:hypothetical protein KHU50_005397 [Colletotrichum sp. SAR 10_65]|nr:hypothetical protein KHU50_005397 [Colletotrichum sp. SAR 10_65]KAI8178630.1 hypothetical protein K4K51_004400 [Colletotrichum sp. SAR 10_75]
MAVDKQQKLPLLTTWRRYPLAKLALKELTPGPKKSAARRTQITWTTDDKNAFRGFLARHSHSPASLSKTDRWSCDGCTESRLQALAQNSLGLDTTRITPAQWAGVRDRMLTHFHYEMSRWVDDKKITQHVNGETGVETFAWDEAVRKSWVATADAPLKKPQEEQPQKVGQDKDDDVDMEDQDDDENAPPQPSPAQGQRQPHVDRQQPCIDREEDAHRRVQQQQQSHSARRGRPLLDTGTNWRLDNLVTTTTTATHDGSIFRAREDNNDNNNNGPVRDDDLIPQPSLFRHFPQSSTVAQCSGALQPVAFPPLDAHGLGATGLKTTSAPGPERFGDPSDSIANPVAAEGRMATQPHVNQQQSRTNRKEEAEQQAQHQQHPPQDDSSFRERGQDNLDNLVAPRGRLSSQPYVNRQQSQVGREETEEQQVQNQHVQHQQRPPRDHATFRPRGDVEPHRDENPGNSIANLVARSRLSTQPQVDRQQLHVDREEANQQVQYEQRPPQDDGTFRARGDNENRDDDPGDSINSLVATRGRLVALAAAERRLRFAVIVGGLANVVREKHRVWAQVKRQGTGLFRAGGVFDMLLGLRDGAARG